MLFFTEEGAYMAKIGILTDTTHCLPAELIDRYHIKVVPVGLVLDGKPYLDQFEITPAEFWDKFEKLKEIPTTFAPNPQEFEKALTELALKNDSIICLLVSKILSGTNSAALAARKKILEKKPGLRIEIIDSKCAAGALGFLVLEAARAAESGNSFEDVIKVVQNLLPRVTYLTALETMKYLIKGGRAPKVAVIGDLLGIRPIITNNKETGEVLSIGRGQGKKNAMSKLVNMVADFADPKKPLHIMVHYTTNLQDGEKLQEMVKAKYNCEELYMTPYTPVMAVHTGPVLSLAFY
jgi:DegV family protein with EDD domain